MTPAPFLQQTDTADIDAAYTTTQSGVALPNVRKGALLPGVPKAGAGVAADYHWAVNDAVNAFVRGNGQRTGPATAPSSATTPTTSATRASRWT